jgi:predicted nucleic acid-binding Zn ribbon protein
VKDREKKEPERIGDLVTRLMARRGYAQSISTDFVRDAWRQIAGELANHSLPGNINRGTLEIVACNSSVVQELTFKKQQLLRELKTLLPKTPINALRFRVGAIE